jgi:lauroyl/myristoyl acyltransferase
MQLEDYLIQRNEIVNNFSKKSKVWQEDIMIAKFNIVSACLSNYLPNIPEEEHKQIFKNIFLHQKLSMFEQSFYELPDYVAYENLNAQIWNLLKKRTSIICTFHTGSYRLINLFLAKNKIPFSLVVSKDVIANQGSSFKEMFNELNNSENNQEALKLIDAEFPNSLLQMIRDLKNGRNLVIYIDGNSGSGNETINNNNNCVINFLDKKIYARQGIGFLSYRMQVPILTVASYRESLNEIKLKFFDPIFPDIEQDRDTFIKSTTQNVYNLIAPIIKKYPEQWEAWLYLHKVADTTENIFDISSESTIFPEADDRFRFNSSCFGIFKIIKDCFLFKKSNYKSYKITDSVYDVLNMSLTEPIVRNQIFIAEFAEIYKSKVLVCA